MSKIIKFKQEETQEHSCPVCDLVDVYIEDIANSESPEELFSLLSEMVNEARESALGESFQEGLDVGFKVGYKGALENDIEIKQKLIADIASELDEECDF